MAKGRKTGGRAAGTPNKATTAIRGVITQMLDKYFNSETFEDDITALDPKDRVVVMEKFTSYAVPKLQATTLDMTVEGKKTIEDRLTELAGDEE